jgi:hypothetical protein
VNDALRGYGTGTDAERGDGGILQIEEICIPKMSALLLGPWGIGSGLATKLLIQRRNFLSRLLTV